MRESNAGRLSLLAIVLIATGWVRAAESPDDAATFALVPGSPYLLFDADLAMSQSRTPPVDDVDWRPVKLPDSWRLHERYLEGTSAWYRFRLPDDAPSEPYSLYLWRFSMNVEAFFNDEQIGSGGTFDEPIARNWNRPFLFALPQSGWRPSGNLLYVHLRIYPGFGTFTPPALGPTRVLAPAYESRYMLQITLSQWAVVVILMVAVVGFTFWFADRRDTTYLYFAGTSLVWSIYGLNLFVQTIPFAAKIWWWLVHTSTDLCSTLMVLFAHRLMHTRRPIIEAVALGWVAIASLLYAFWDLPMLARYNNYTHTVTFFGLAYVTCYAVWRGIRYRDPDAIFLSLGLTVLVAMVTHDLVLNSLAVPALWATRFFLVQFGAPLMLLLFLIHMARRLAGALRETRSANVRLEARVHEVTEALEEGYRKRQVLEHDRVAAAERERIYQDLHDDVGAKLLSLVYASHDDAQAGLARDALREMRTIVASDALEGGELRHAAADWRVEAERRCEEAGCTLHWEEHVDDTHLSGMQRYHLDRIVRELVSNALEHSGGNNIRAAVFTARDRLTLSIEDDGRGFTDGDVPSSHGLLGIRRRVAGLNGEVEWGEGTSGGVTCRIDVPLSPPSLV